MAKKRAAPATPKHLPLVAGSGQTWKVTVGIGAMTVAAVASIIQFVGPAAAREAAVAVTVVTGLGGIAAMLAIRCPACNRALAVWAFQTGSLTSWQERLVTVTACPACGHAVPERDPGAPP